ncbi:MAG: M48 family metallopeptidase [Bacteroidales bacterium]|nr:M48 family metallopeptidase [Bacteroidales bacterium]
MRKDKIMAQRSSSVANSPSVSTLSVSESSIAAKRFGALQFTLAQIAQIAKIVLPERTKTMYQLVSQKVTIRNSKGELVENPFRYRRVAIKNNSTNWGSCSTLRNINLNMHLVRLPIELMDYVIAHELCHLVYPNHSVRFHNLLNAITDGKEAALAHRLNKFRL